jgi:hypothetical protein
MLPGYFAAWPLKNVAPFNSLQAGKYETSERSTKSGDDNHDKVATDRPVALHARSSQRARLREP